MLPTLTPARVEEQASRIREIANTNFDLQVQNRQIREKSYELQLKCDYHENYKHTLEDLERRLRKTNPDDISQQLIDLSTKLSEYKLTELRAKREAGLSREKEEYYQRINRQHLDHIKQIENELAVWDIKFTQREEFWRKRFNEQIKLVFKNGEPAPDAEDKGSDFISKKLKEISDKRVEAQRVLAEQRKEIEEKSGVKGEGHGKTPDATDGAPREVGGTYSRDTPANVKELT